MRWIWERRLRAELAPVDDSIERAKAKREAQHRLSAQRAMWPEVLDTSRRVRKIRRENALGAAVEEAFRSRARE